MSVLSEQSQHVVVMVSVSFGSQCGFVSTISRIADEFQRRFEFQHWNGNSQRFIFRDPKRHWVVVVNHRQIQFQMLGLKSWTENFAQNVKMTEIVLEQFKISAAKIDFEISSFVDLGMQFTELNSLMFGSFLVDSSQITETFESHAVDSEVSVHFEDESDQAAIKLSPMSDEQIRNTFLATPNLDAFKTDPAILDSSILEFLAGLPECCMFMGFSVTLADVARGEIESHLRRGLAWAEGLADRAVSKIKELPIKSGRS